VRKKRNALPTIHQRVVIEGFVHTYDRGGRECLDVHERERIVLVRDLRVYGRDLHIGALGWTMPETGDGYHAVDVVFDDGQRFRLSRYAFERVAAGSEGQVANELIHRFKGTRFDVDPEVAADCRKQWIQDQYGPHMNVASTIHAGTGDQELYAFTFPTLKELAAFKGEHRYPTKIGFSKDQAGGALRRIRSQTVDQTAYPERPEVLLVWRTWDGRSLETQVHSHLRLLRRRARNSIGKEWFITSTEELREVISRCDLSGFPHDRVICGAEETIEEELEKLMEDGATIEMEMLPGQAVARIEVRYPEEDVQ
jgi:hypothetical protein